MADRDEHEDSYGHILKYTGLFGGVQGVNILVSLVRNKLVALLLGPSGMGLASLFNSTVSFVSQATNLGISFSAVRNISELSETGDATRVAHFVKVVRSWSVLTAVLGFLLCVLVGPLSNRYSFSWGDHTLHFVLLAPAVALLALTGGETAILKGTHRLRALAVVQLYSVFAALLISLPLYYFFGESAIVPVITLMGLASMLFTLHYSLRLFPLRLEFSREVLGEGMAMVRLGVAFVVAGVLTAGADIAIRYYLNINGGLEVVGLYNAGFMLTMTYAGLVFSAMETDYYPRLSAIGARDVALRNDMVNKQIEVTQLIISPMLVVLIIGLPVIVPLLFSREFLALVAMSQVILLSMYLRSMYLPIAYVTLARGDSLVFLALEAVYNVLVVFFVIVGFKWQGVLGTGIAIALANCCDLLMAWAVMRRRYGFRLSVGVVRVFALQFPLGVMAFGLAMVSGGGWAYWLAGTLLGVVSLGLSLRILHRKTSLWNALVQKVEAKFGIKR